MAVNLVKSRNQKTNRALTAEWSTPQWLFDELDKEFHFTLDACAQPFNAKCKKFYSPKENGLEQNWKDESNLSTQSFLPGSMAIMKTKHIRSAVGCVHLWS